MGVLETLAKQSVIGKVSDLQKLLLAQVESDLKVKMEAREMSNSLPTLQ